MRIAFAISDEIAQITRRHTRHLVGEEAL